MKKLVTLLLFLGLGVSILHAYMIDDYHQESVQEFVAEFSSAGEHGDLCDLHYEFHVPFVLNDIGITIEKIDTRTIPQTSKHHHPKPLRQELLKPPIL